MYRKPDYDSPWSDQLKLRKPSTKKCPFCDPERKPFDPFRESRCVLNQPLMMVIPPGGVHLECPVHSEGHHVFGPQVTFCENNLPERGSEPTCGYDMMYRPDQNRFSM